MTVRTNFCRVPLTLRRPIPLFAFSSPSFSFESRQRKEKIFLRPLASPSRPRPKALRLAALGGPGEPRTDKQQRGLDQKIILGTGVGLTAAICLVATFGGDSVLELAAWEGVDLGQEGSLGAGDLVGALLWSVALYYASPWQLLLLFIGKIETERPSDAVLRFFGKLGNLRVDAIDYVAPAWVRATTVLVFAGGGFSIAAAMGAWLGDASWSISTGLGACVAAGMYEVGRPQRLSVEEAQLLENQWKDFEAFAFERLQKVGRCHESEIIRAFRRTKGRYRQATGPNSVLSDATIKDMIRNYHPTAERTGSGYYKNLSLRDYAAENAAAAAEQQQQGLAASTVGSASGSTGA